MTPTYDDHHHHGASDSKLDQILCALHKLNRKVERLIQSQDFSLEDASARAVTQDVKAATKRIPGNPQPKG